MELKFDEVCAERFIRAELRETDIEAELPLPAPHRAAETGVLACCGSAAVEGAAVRNGAVEVSGHVSAETVCAARDGGLFSFSSSAAFTKTFTMEEAEEGMSALAAARLVSFEVTGGERLTLSAALELECELTDSRPLRLLSGADGAELLFTEASGMRRTEVYSDAVRLREEVEIEGASEALCLFAGCGEAELAARDGGAQLEGVLYISAVMKNADGTPVPFSSEFPFSFDISAETDARERAYAIFDVQAAGLRPSAAGEGVFTLEARIGAKVFTEREETVACIADAYVPGTVLGAAAKELELVSEGPWQQLTVEMKELIPLPEGMPRAERALMCAVLPSLTAAEACGDALCVEGVASVRAVYISGGGTLCSARGEFPIACGRACAGEGDAVRAEVRCIKSSCRAVQGGIEASFTLLILARRRARAPLRLALGMEEAEIPSDARRPRGIVVYYPSAGETLFDVGRRFAVSRAELLAANPGANESLSDRSYVMLINKA